MTSVCRKSQIAYGFSARIPMEVMRESAFFARVFNYSEIYFQWYAERDFCPRPNLTIDG